MLRAPIALLLMLLSPSAAQAKTGPIGERVEIDGFAIDRTEVTIGQFKAFVSVGKLVTAAEKEGGGFEYTSGWTRRSGWTWNSPYGDPGADSEPVTHVSWFEAREYCVYAGGRLPTFEEWKRAAYTETRAAPSDGFERGRTYAYPVGDMPEGMNNSRQRHVSAGTTKRGVNGLYEMGANVWEWTSDRQGDTARTAGGSWWYGPETARADAAQWKPAGFYVVYIGFRCAYDLKR